LSPQDAIRDTIFSTILAAYANTSDNPALSPYQNQSIQIAQVWPGQIIPDAQYGNAWTPTNPKGLQAATENLSILADPIPNIAPWYSQSGRRVEEMYKFLLGATPDFTQTAPLTAASAPDNFLAELADRTQVTVPTPTGGTIQTFALKESARLMKRLEIDHSNAAAAATAHLLATAAREPANTDQQAKRRAVVSEATAALEALHSGDITGQAQRLQQLAEKATTAWEALQSAKAQYSPAAMMKESSQSSIASQPSTASVAKAFQDAVTMFARSTLASVNNPGIQYHPTYTSPEDWVSAAAAQQWPMTTMPVPGLTPAVNLTLSYSRVDFTRPWLLASLFQLNDWTTSGGAGSLSSGASINNNGTFALLPMSIIVTRDIVARDSSMIIFRSTALQVLAWVSKIVPYSPPK